MSSDSQLPSARAGATRAAWRRWEMHEVGAQTAAPAAHAKPAAEPAIDPSQDIDQLIEQVLAQAQEQGHAQGYDAGFEQGKQAGRAQGHAEGLKTGREKALAEQDKRLAKLDALLTDTEHALERLDTDIAQGIVELALRLARQVVQTTLAVRPEALLDTVRELLQPQEGQLGWIRLRIHPDDHDMLAQYFRSLPAPPPWQLIQDAAIAPGGCLLETSLGQVDATLRTRWQRMAGSLGTPIPDWQETT